jgi:hypothetical protein
MYQALGLLSLFVNPPLRFVAACVIAGDC